MGGCWSQQSIDSESMKAEFDASSAVERSEGNDLVQSNLGPVPAQVGSSEYVGAYMPNDVAHENVVESKEQVSNYQVEQPLPPVTSDVHYDHLYDNEIVLIPQENTVNVNVDQPIYQQTFVEQPMVEQTPNNQISDDQPVHPVSSYDQAVLPAQSSAKQVVDVTENVQILGTQQAEHNDLSIVFEGRTYGRRVFDPNLNEYVYVEEDDQQPQGGLVM